MARRFGPSGGAGMVRVVVISRLGIVSLHLILFSSQFPPSCLQASLRLFPNGSFFKNFLAIGSRFTGVLASEVSRNMSDLSSSFFTFFFSLFGRSENEVLILAGGPGVGVGRWYHYNH